MIVAVSIDGSETEQTINFSDRQNIELPSIDGIRHWRPETDEEMIARQVGGKPWRAVATSRAEYESAVEKLTDSVARSRDFGSAVEARAYAAYSTVAQWTEEAKAFAAWCDDVWLRTEEIMRLPIAHRPTVEAHLESLPSIEWP